MSRIQRLSTQLANQIAAGEVIERPASMVKELVENSLDAGATRIEVAFNALLSELSVEDNGHGIEAADLTLALAPHATSKLLQAADLWNIKTLGFRGEALASIAAIAKITLISRAQGCEQAWQIKAVPCQDPVCTPTARAVGTTVWVEDCFFNVPVRRRFLKSAKTEIAHIVETVKRYALRYPKVSFFVKMDRKDILQAPAVTQEHYSQRLTKLLSKQFVDHALYLEVQDADWKLTGWIAKEQGLRRQADWQYWFLNGRPVRDKVLFQALRQAYQHTIALGYYPACVLFLELPAAEVDVNVHPTKHEVRFCQPTQVHAFVFEPLRQALLPAMDEQDVLLPAEMEPVSSLALAPMEVMPHPIVTAPVMPIAPVLPMPVTVPHGFLWQDLWIVPAAKGVGIVHFAAFEQWAIRQFLEKTLATAGKLPTYPLLFPHRQILTMSEKECLEMPVVQQKLNCFGFYYQLQAQQCCIQTHAQGLVFDELWKGFWALAQAVAEQGLEVLLAHGQSGGLGQLPGAVLQDYLAQAFMQDKPFVSCLEKNKLIDLIDSL